MSFFLFQNSATSVTVYPEWDYEDRLAKMQEVDRGLTGQLFIYQFGSYRDFKIPVTYVTSADKTRIESWWMAGTSLYWMNSGGTPVSVRITNDVTPFTKRVKPYIDRFQGVIELGGL